ncbi:uncharacterized protein [Rhodnius prolixus]|uniref:uncharacterized protein n=1 Tax=Rhodnius prolixus TaxID=13249 RepID=UPI003D18B3CE
MEPVKNSVNSETELRALAVETLGECYPSPPWTHIYTGGSAEGATENAGAGVYGTNFQFSEPVGTWASNFDGEIRAILIGLRYVVERKLDQVVFLCDSQAALIAVTGAQSGVSADVRACQEMIAKILIEGKHLAFQWIPAHC